MTRQIGSITAQQLASIAALETTPVTRPDTSPSRQMSILIADDHALFSDSLTTLLQSHGYQVLGQAKDGRETVEMTFRLEPDLVLMDLTMPKLDGLAATRLIKSERPEIKVVVLTASEDDDLLFEAIKSGAEGYLFKNLDSTQFFDLLEKVANGEPGLSPGLARKLLTEFARPRESGRAQDPDALTAREMEVLELLVQGVTTNRKLASTLGVTENTVKFHVRNILDKLHLNNRAQVVSYAVRNRLVEPPPPDPDPD